LSQTCTPCPCGLCIHAETVAEHVAYLRDSEQTETTKERRVLHLNDLYELQETGTHRAARKQSHFLHKQLDALWRGQLLEEEEEPQSPAGLVVEEPTPSKGKHTVVSDLVLTVELLRAPTFSPRNPVAFTTGRVIQGNDYLVEKQIPLEMKTFNSRIRESWTELKKGDVIKVAGRIERNEARARYEFVVDNDDTGPSEDDIKKAFGL